MVHDAARTAASANRHVPHSKGNANGSESSKKEPPDVQSQFEPGKDARFAHQLVVDAAKEFETRRQKWLEEHGPWNKPGTATCGTSKTVNVDKYVDEFRTIMMTIARTAAEAFTERGC